LLPLWSLALAWIASKLWRGGPDWRAYVGVFAWVIGLHIAFDWITSFGTLILAPISDRRFALSTTFIIDLWLSGLLLAGLAACAIFRSTRAPAVACLALVAGYIAFQGVQQQRAIEVASRHAAAQGMRDAKVSALPRPGSPYNWMAVAEEGDRVDVAQIRLVDEPPLLTRLGSEFLDRLASPYLPPERAAWTRVDRYGRGADADLARAALASEELAFFRWFAGHPSLYRIDRTGESTCVWFQDLRFVTPGRDVIPFRYGACRTGPSDWQAYELVGDAPVLLR
jgi:inner membrane protein